MRKFGGPLVAVGMLLFLISACSSGIGLPKVQQAMQDDLEELNAKVTQVAGEMQNTLRSFSPADKTIAVATFVDLDNLEHTSAFGRYVSEQLSGELHQIGFNVRELRQRVVVTPVPLQGEMALSRRSAELIKEFPVDAMLVGAYTRVGSKVVVNIRLVDTAVSRVVSVGRLVIEAPLQSYVAHLLLRETHDITKTRVPVVRLSAAGV